MPSSDTPLNAIIATVPLGSQWPTLDPFLFCAHHDDAYPAGNAQLGPAASLAGRTMGQDFEGRDGWRMYHGDAVPGFPQHPHRGFETVTIVRTGRIDHSDSLGATARFGGGDVQWLTAGKGISHCEMFPLLDSVGPNPAELFQIWLNLPRRNKMVEPHFTMFWHEKIPVVRVEDPAGRSTEITVIAGGFGGAFPLPCPPDSWAAQAGSDVAIWTVRMEAGARFTLGAAPGTTRILYFFAGMTLTVAGRAVPVRTGVQLRADIAVDLENGGAPGEWMLLQGRPIGEPVVQHGPFVMNTQTEIHEAFADYRRTKFGGWPWPSDEPVHPREQGRFARHPDGRSEAP
ncbi:MAG: pirin family protein [Myxococcales bacterium]|nr:pirin family protein [Myxococcales bacterium]